MFLPKSSLHRFAGRAEEGGILPLWATRAPSGPRAKNAQRGGVHGHSKWSSLRSITFVAVAVAALFLKAEAADYSGEARLRAAGSVPDFRVGGLVAKVEPSSTQDMGIELLLPGSKHALSTANNWTQLGSDLDGKAAGDKFGRAVALSGDGLTVATSVAIGAHHNNGNDINSGHVRIFTYNINAASWEQLGNDIDGEAEEDGSGISVALSKDGHTVAIGAPYNDGSGTNSGHARIFTFSTSTASWEQLGGDVDGKPDDDGFGYSVALSEDGRRLAVGAPWGNANSWHARIYAYSIIAERWEQLGNDLDGEGHWDHPGYSVALSGDGLTVAIGAANNAAKGQPVRIYNYNTNTANWQQLGGDIYGEAADDRSGWRVDLSKDGRTVAIGAHSNDGNGAYSGHVRIYSFNANTASWVQVGSDIDGERAGDLSGFSVALSEDGHTVAIGAIGNDDNGNGSGHVRVYTFNSNTASWEQLATDIDGEAEGDNFGISVALAGDGCTVAIGADSNDGNGINSGHVRIYSLSPPTASALNGAFFISDPNVTAIFNDTTQSGNNELLFEYTVVTPETNKAAFAFRLLDGSCNSSVNVDNIYLNVSSTKLDGNEVTQNNYTIDLMGSQTMDVAIDVKQDTIIDSPFFQYLDGANTTGRIDFCAKYLIMYDIDDDTTVADKDYEAVTYHQTSVQLNVDFSQGFTVSSVGLALNDIAQNEETAGLEYELNAYQCNANGDPASTEIKQSSILYICVETDSADVGIREIRDLTFTQSTSGISIAAINQGNPNALTTSTTQDAKNKKWLVSSRLILPFFDNNFGGADLDVVASGIAVMAFQDDFGLRHWNLVGFNLRGLQDGGSADFAVEFTLSSAEEERLIGDVTAASDPASAAFKPGSMFAILVAGAALSVF